MIRTDIVSDSINATHDSSVGTRQIRFSESPGTLERGTKEEIIPSTGLLATLSLPPSGNTPFTPPTSSTTGRRDWGPSMASMLEDGFQGDKEENLREILRHAQTLRSLIAPGNWREQDDSIEQGSNTTSLGTPQATLPSDIRSVSAHTPFRGLCLDLPQVSVSLGNL